MALVVEDGSLVDGANSYISVADARAYATARGLTFPANDDAGNAAAEILLTLAMDVVESYRDRYQGAKVEYDQGTQFPRSGMTIDGIAFAADEIPDVLPKAQAQLAIEAQTSTLFANSDGREVTRKNIAGAVETEWASTGGSNPQPRFAAVEALLAPLFGGKNSVRGSFLRTVRV